MKNVEKTVPSLLLIGSIVRTLIVGAQLSDSLIILGLCGLVYLLNNLKYNKESIQVQQEIADLRAEVRKFEKENAEVKQYVSGVKMATSLTGKRA